MPKRIAALFAAILFLAACAPTLTPTPPPGVTGTPPSSLSQIKHIFVVVMENKRYADIWGSPSAPYINSLGSQYARAANYHALTYPSLPNYLQLFAVTNGGITTDCSPSDSCHLNA